MRSCLLSVILLVLLAASGYAIWQIQLLRADVAGLRAQLREDRQPTRRSMVEHARNALEALGRGESERAQEELDRLGELIEQTQTMAGQKRDRLRQRLAQAKEAVARGGARASELLADLLRELSPDRAQEKPPEPDAP
jgi:hypothetical protein